MTLPNPRSSDDWCFRVWAKTRYERTCTPIIQAPNVAAVRDKLAHLYPGSELLEITPLHRSDNVSHREVVAL